MKKITEYFKELKEMTHKLDMSRVYIGVYESSNQESLFYKVNLDTYYDFKLKKSVSLNEIDKNSLILCNNIIECNNNTEKNIVKLYDLDRMEKIKLSRVYIGNSYQITEVLNREINCYEPGVSDIATTTYVNTQVVDHGLLLYATSRNLDYADFINLENGDRYTTLYYLEKGDIYIPVKNNLTTSAFKLNISGVDIEKGKLLEKYREYKRR